MLVQEGYFRAQAELVNEVAEVRIPRHSSRVGGQVVVVLDERVPN